MADQVVRSEVIAQYTSVDEHLNLVLIEHFFGRGKLLRRRRLTKRFRTFRLVLQRLYFLRKLGLIRSFRAVPNRIVSSLYALNELRNGIAHAFFVRDMPRSKQVFKNRDVFDSDGLEFFREDMRLVHEFFNLELRDLFAGLEDNGQLGAASAARTQRLARR